MSTISSPDPAPADFRPLRADGLPLFRRDTAEFTVFYVPGRLCVVPRAEAERFAETIAPVKGGRPPGEADWGGELWRRVREVIFEDQRRREAPFRPECLTLYLNNECNLNCVYCYADPSAVPTARLEMESISRAAELVAENCHDKNLPFTNVFHGGGEPTFHLERLRRALALLDGVALANEVTPFRYLATNGVLSAERAEWLAPHFDLVGLSCDGPAEIHDRQRPRWDGRGSLADLERSARVLRGEGCRFQVRTTITRQGVGRQAEIAGYLCQQLTPAEIHFEPLYRGGRAGDDAALTADLAGEFVAHFLEARAVAQGYGIPLVIAGSRPGSIHGPHCNVFRQTLNLVPGAVATACFKLCDADQVVALGAGVGALDRKAWRFAVDLRQVQALRERLTIEPTGCAGCFNRYHCARGCPDLCPLEDEAAWLACAGSSFRCRVQKTLTAAILAETAERLWQEALAEGTKEPRGVEIS